jgi:hypothetical protein
MFVAWTYDLDVEGPPGQSGRELFCARAKLPIINIVNTNSSELKEQVLGRRVLRIQVEPDDNTPKSPPGAQIVRLKNLGWYAAGLVPPVRKPAQ